MTTAPQDLVLLTARFPFDDHEAVLAPELEILAQRFARVFVLPSHRGDDVRPLPPNVELKELAWLDAPARAAKVRALASLEALRVLAASLRRPSRWRAYFGNWRFYLDLLGMQLLKARVLERFVAEEQLHDAVFYDYWFENSTLPLALLRRRGQVRIAVSRAHNFDIYDEDWASGAVPFAEFKARALDHVFPVSEHGQRYLREHLPLAAKTSVARLGVEAQDAVAPPHEDVPVIVSCAWVHPRKRIDLIPEVLTRIGKPVRWIHFGDGAERARVEAAAAKLPGHVEWELRGRVDNSEVLDFYRRRHVDVLLSLSVSEGVPVAMMEAQSFGIAIVAVAVRGIPDIVTGTTGVLLDIDDGVDELAAGLAAALEPGRFDRAAILAFFRDHFEATRNYGEFADTLAALGGGR
jgi:glycosyltransferase involved in cell wall biosynthesis